MYSLFRDIPQRILVLVADVSGQPVLHLLQG